MIRLEIKFAKIKNKSSIGYSLIKLSTLRDTDFGFDITMNITIDEKTKSGLKGIPE